MASVVVLNLTHVRSLERMQRGGTYRRKSASARCVPCPSISPARTCGRRSASTRVEKLVVAGAVRRWVWGGAGGAGASNGRQLGKRNRNRTKLQWAAQVPAQAHRIYRTSPFTHAESDRRTLRHCGGRSVNSARFSPRTNTSPKAAAQLSNPEPLEKPATTTTNPSARLQHGSNMAAGSPHPDYR